MSDGDYSGENIVRLGQLADQTYKDIDWQIKTRRMEGVRATLLGLFLSDPDTILTGMDSLYASHNVKAKSLTKSVDVLLSSHFDREDRFQLGMEPVAIEALASNSYAVEIAMTERLAGRERVTEDLVHYYKHAGENASYKALMAFARADEQEALEWWGKSIAAGKRQLELAHELNYDVVSETFYANFDICTNALRPLRPLLPHVHKTKGAPEIEYPDNSEYSLAFFEKTAEYYLLWATHTVESNRIYLENRGEFKHTGPDNGQKAIFSRYWGDGLIVPAAAVGTYLMPAYIGKAFLDHARSSDEAADRVFARYPNRGLVVEMFCARLVSQIYKRDTFFQTMMQENAIGKTRTPEWRESLYRDFNKDAQSLSEDAEVMMIDKPFKDRAAVHGGIITNLWGNANAQSLDLVAGVVDEFKRRYTATTNFPDELIEIAVGQVSTYLANLRSYKKKEFGMGKGRRRRNQANSGE